MPESITVEVFREASVPKSEVLHAHEGISLVSGISSVLEIVKDSRLMHLKSENGWANTDKISWPKFDANINIVLTHKALQKNSDIELLNPRGDLEVSNYIGRTLGSLGLKYMSAVLLINTANSESTPTTTAHEIGHAIGLKTEGENFDGYLHCKSSDCLMFQASETLTETITTTSKLFGLYRKTVRSIESVDNGHTFVMNAHISLVNICTF